MSDQSEAIQKVRKDAEKLQDSKKPSTPPPRAKPQQNFVSRRDYGDAFDEKEMNYDRKY